MYFHFNSAFREGSEDPDLQQVKFYLFKKGPHFEIEILDSPRLKDLSDRIVDWEKGNLEGEREVALLQTMINCGMISTSLPIPKYLNHRDKWESRMKHLHSLKLLFDWRMFFKGYKECLVYHIFEYIPEITTSLYVRNYHQFPLAEWCKRLGLLVISTNSDGTFSFNADGYELFDDSWYKELLFSIKRAPSDNMEEVTERAMELVKNVYQLELTKNTYQPRNWR